MKSIASVLLAGVVLVTFTMPVPASAGTATPASLRTKARQLMNGGNAKEALELYRQLILNADTERDQVGYDLQMALHCLQALNRENESDALRQSAVSIHSNNWRFLQSAATSFISSSHDGTIIAGKFERGPHRGQGKYANSMERDRVAGLQLFAQALAAAGDEKDTRAVADLHMQFANAIMNSSGNGESWRLQSLTDLSQLPDYDESYNYYSGQIYSAPADEHGNPVLYRTPETFQAAQNDGERWRWLLWKCADLDKARGPEIKWTLAGFFHQQFGVQTMSHYGWFARDTDNGDKDESGPYEVQTLKDGETIALLAGGIKRFTLPDEFNPVKILQSLSASRNSYSEGSLNFLAQIMEDRRQYNRAAMYWKESLKLDGQGDSWKQQRLDQIEGNWGQFEPAGTHPAGRDATLEFRFRNGKKLHVEAAAIDISALLYDVKEYLKSNPRQLDGEKMEIENIGYQLVTGKQAKYVGKPVEKWEIPLQPREGHFDRLITIKTPLKKAGAYLLTAQMENGNTSKIVVWINDTILVQKQLDKKAMYYVADAVSGQPVVNAKLDFFGYYQKYLGSKLTRFSREYDVITAHRENRTDDRGIAYLVPGSSDDYRWEWIITASTPEGRLAYLGFRQVWHSNYHDSEYNQTRAYAITDRPVYRPNQSVKFKFWVRHARYDQEDSSTFAGRSFTLRINNPKGEKILEKTLTADAFGGFDGEYALPADATLGVYVMDIAGIPMEQATFRVEEYKKPEFEVTVDSPADPVMLGDRISARITARYYFGSPVKSGRVKYKITRTDYNANWYPAGRWDWFYGTGYWWFAYDYNWYPRWSDWGCFCPTPWWWHSAQPPPEIVAEATVPVGEDGTVKIDIDTAVAAKIYSNKDHRYEITAEVTDESRRTITGQGSVLVARKPFKVYAWVDRGHYRPGDTIQAGFNAQTLDGKPVKGKGRLKLFRITYERQAPGFLGRITGRNSKVPTDTLAPVELEIENWNLDTDGEGRSGIQIKAAKAGQYRLSYTVTDTKDHEIEGGYMFVVRGDDFDEHSFRFNDIELVPDQKEYAPGETLQLAVNTERQSSTVLLFVRAANGVCLEPKILYIKGKSTMSRIEVMKKDMPNFFVEALTISDGRVHTQTREIVVPPESRILGMDVLPSAKEYKPGEKASIKVKLTDAAGEPFAGSTVLTVYDKSVEYISGGSNVAEIKAFFWKWRRQHSPVTFSSADRQFYNLTLPNARTMLMLGAFGDSNVDAVNGLGDFDGAGLFSIRAEGRPAAALCEKAAAPEPARISAGSMIPMPGSAVDHVVKFEAAGAGPDGKSNTPNPAQPALRKDFADTAFWNAAVATDSNGLAEVSFKMPENITGWKIRSWAMGHGTKVGEATADVVTKKNLLLRLQAPRFFVEKDEVVLSANIHNYLKTGKSVSAVLELDGGCLDALDKTTQTLEIKAGAEQRVDWRVKVVREGEATVRMKALTDEESDAMQVKFPVYVHGMLKTESYCGVIRPAKDSATLTVNVPAERRIEQSSLEIRYSPTLAGAMVDALPYMVDYPYGCTEQTLNRFLPTVICQKIIRNMGVDLKAIKEKQTNLNAQETGDDRKRAGQWKHWERNPVFDEAVVSDMVSRGIHRLSAMQLTDGGWGWFSGWGEQSYPHTTAYVVHGLKIAAGNDVAVPADVMNRGVEWLKRYQNEQIRLLLNDPGKTEPWKSRADDLDAFIYMVLVDADHDNARMRDFLYRDRNDLSVYAKSMLGLALHKTGQKEKLAMIMRNIEQFLVEDPENQTAYLNLGNGTYWWNWYGSENEAHAYYLKLLAATDPKSGKAAGLVKYLLNNRKHATYWNSTRDTAICIEAMAEYLTASGEDKPDMSVEIFLDGQKRKEVAINRDNLFSFDNKLLITGRAVEAGKHTIEIKRKGTGPVYFNAYLTNFTLEDNITRAGLEIKVDRKYYKLTPADRKIKTAGARGQALDQKVEKYERKELANLSGLKSGELVEVELEAESKNDYEYIMLEDMKPAGFEPVEIRSGYNGNDMGAYVEFRDERVCMFIRALARGRHSISYRMRAEIPGSFSALPAKAGAMYAPELKANSDEIKLKVTD